MSVSYQHRGLSELHPASTRNFGVPAASLAAIQQLNLNHNALRSLECPFAGPRGAEAGHSGGYDFSRHVSPPQPLRPDTAMSSEARGRFIHAPPTEAAGTVAAQAMTTLSLEEESSGLRVLTSLAQLLVSHNELRTLRGLCGAAQTLTTLVATHNHLTSLDGLQACRQLTYIDLSYNAIDSLRGLPLTSAAVCGATAPVARSTSLRSAAPSSQRARTPPPLPSELPEAAAAPPDAAVAVSPSALGLSFIEEDNNTDTSSVAFSAHTSPSEARRLRLHETSAAAAAARRSASTNTSVQFQIDESLLGSVGTPAAFELEGAKPDTTAADGAEAVALPAREVVLILSHNRLRGRALAALLYVDGGSDGDTPMGRVGERGSSASPLLRPWSTALTSLDLSYNFIEDISDIRRLVAPVPCPSEGSAAAESQGPGTTRDTVSSSSTGSVCAPVLPRLRRLDVSGNPCLVNGSLARDIQSAAATRGRASPHLLAHSTHALARRGTAKPGDVSSTTPHAAVVLPVAFGLRYTSQALADAVRTSTESLLNHSNNSSATSAAAGLSSLAAAQPAMEAVLRCLAEDWRDTPLLPQHNHRSSDNNPHNTSALPSAPPVLFALFSPAERRGFVDAVAAAARPASSHHQSPPRLSAVLHGAEVTVYAAALQQRGARLGSVVCISHADRPDTAARLLSSSSIAEAAARRSPAARPTTRAAVSSRVTTVEAFLTPPPKWGSETSTSATFLQTSLLSGGSPPPRAPAARLDRRRLDDAREGPSSEERTSTNALESSTAGYRLLPGRSSSSTGPGASHAFLAAPAAAEEEPRGGSAMLEGDTDKENADAVTPRHAKVSVSPSPQPRPTRLAASPRTDDGVTLHLYRAEVATLRRRFRELQRHTRDQACVLQRHESAVRALTAQAAAAQRERDAALAELATAKEEIQRLQAKVRALAEGEDDG